MDATSAPSSPPPTERWKTSHLVLLVLTLASLAPWVMVVWLSFFAFDAPGSETNPLLWAFVLPIWLYPLAVLVTVPIALLLRKRGRLRSGLAVLALPLGLAAVWVLLAGALLLWDLVAS